MIPPDTTAQDIIKWFSDLNLPVCDDQKTIEKAVNKQKKRLVSDLRSPNNHERASKQIAHNELLLKNRPECLSLVYELFDGMAKVSIDAALDAGIKKVTQRTIDSLGNIARTQVRLDDELTQRFVSQFLNAHDIPPGGDLARPGLVSNFTAKSTDKGIELSWRLPDKNWDYVEILRRDESSKTEATEVYRGKDSHWRDSSAKPGRSYEYHIRSSYSDIKGQVAIDHAPCIGEVVNPRAELKNGQVHLSWELPSPGLTVTVSRQANKRPTGRPTPGSGEEIIYSGGGVQCVDSQVPGGCRYHYLIRTEFGRGMSSPGAEVKIHVERPPHSPAWVRATYIQNSDADEVQVKWPSSGKNERVRYILVRGDGNTAPTSLSHGCRVQESEQCGAIDRNNIRRGSCYTYAVFACRGSLYSTEGTASAPVPILPDVMGLKKELRSGSVMLWWCPPKNVDRIVVRRALGSAPKTPSDGTEVPVINHRHIQDTGLENGRVYHYSVWCAYKPDGKTEVFSKGITTSGMPELLPEMAEDIRVGSTVDKKVVCLWKPPQHGTVIVLRTPKPISWKPGRRIDSDQLGNLGGPIPIVDKESGRAEDLQPTLTEPYYGVFTVAGSRAIVGGCICCPIVPDVTGLKVRRTLDGARLTWTWPAGCNSVVVARRAGAWPEGPKDPNAIIRTITRTEYRDGGERFDDQIGTKERQRFHYIVYTEIRGPSSHLLVARGKTGDCRDVVDAGPWMIVSYALRETNERIDEDPCIELVWTVEKCIADFDGFVLLANETHIPSSLEDDLVLYEHKGPLTTRSQRVCLSLARVRQRGWAAFYCKLFVKAPSQRGSTVMIHPDVRVPIDDNGYRVCPEPPALKRVYGTRPPKKVVCPDCLEAFPTKEMLFGDNQSDERFKGVRTLLRRVKPPKDKNGNPYTDRFCPNKHLLPITSGRQESLVIGLIGEAESGKSTYIATLIDRLEGRTGCDWHSSLLPLTEGTPKRYKRDFEEPLLINRKELPADVGTPPPLIYDMTFNGSLWGERRNRSVTLAFYDTAGENTTSNAAQAQKTLKYLGVASGVIFIVDPLQIPQVRQTVPDHLLPRQHPAGAPSTVIANILGLLDGSAFKKGRPMPVPVAIVLSKCDVLEGANLIEPNRIWCDPERRSIRRFNQQYHDDMSGMMGECLWRWDMAAYNNICTRFPRHAFFGVSSTGCAAINRQYKHVSPHRVEDPLLWLLAQVGVLPVKHADMGGSGLRQRTLTI